MSGWFLPLGSRALRSTASVGLWVLFGAWATAQETAKRLSPFESVVEKAAEPVAPSSPELDALEFTGVSSILDQRSFNFTDRRTRKSFWVPLEGTENDFSVVSYDEQQEQVVVQYGRHTRTIGLRKAKLVATPPASTIAAAPNNSVAAGPSAGGGVDELRNPKTPEEIKQAEYEARMMVSDLLDISMQERARQKALRDAARAANATPATKSAANRR